MICNLGLNSHYYFYVVILSPGRESLDCQLHSKAPHLVTDFVSGTRKPLGLLVVDFVTLDPSWLISSTGVSTENFPSTDYYLVLPLPD